MCTYLLLTWYSWEKLCANVHKCNLKPCNNQNRERLNNTPYTNSTTNDGKQFQFFNSLLYINYLCADHQLYLSNIKNEHIACFSIKDEPNSFGRGANNNFSNFNYYTFNICTPLIYSNNECNPTTMFLRTSVPTTLARENYFFFLFPSNGWKKIKNNFPEPFVVLVNWYILQMGSLKAVDILSTFVFFSGVLSWERGGEGGDVVGW